MIIPAEEMPIPPRAVQRAGKCRVGCAIAEGTHITLTLELGLMHGGQAHRSGGQMTFGLQSAAALGQGMLDMTFRLACRGTHWACVTLGIAMRVEGR
ncbi:hypothetical protein D3C75_900380 [compost metagenome]